MSKRYVVTGVLPVCGTQPGGEFEADLPEHQEAVLVEGGAIRVLLEKQRKTLASTIPVAEELVDEAPVDELVDEE